MEKKKTEQATRLEVFNFNEKSGTPIRVQLINDEPWFVAKDVCKVLGITWSGHTLDQIPNDWKGSVSFTTPGGNQQLVSISEAGLYKLAFRCNSSEKADKFTNWVAGEVLPRIRKTGGYRVSGRRRDDYLDWRDRPYRRVSYRNGDVRVVEEGDERWYSVNDLLRCLGSRTESTQCVRRLNRRGDLARKILLYGMTHPGWFANTLGSELLTCGSLKGRVSVQLTLEFT